MSESNGKKRRPLDGTGVFVLQIDKPKQTLAFVLLALAMAFGFYEDWRDDNARDRADERIEDASLLLAQQARAIVQSSRSECEHTNTLRENQARLLITAIRQTRRTLDDLGDLERFRAQIVEQNEERKQAVTALAADAAEHPKFRVVMRDGEPVLDEAGRPKMRRLRFTIDCEKAYPDVPRVPRGG